MGKLSSPYCRCFYSSSCSCYLSSRSWPLPLLLAVPPRRHSVPMVCHPSLAVPSACTLSGGCSSSYSLNMVSGEHPHAPPTPATASTYFAFKSDLNSYWSCKIYLNVYIHAKCCTGSSKKLQKLQGKNSLKLLKFCIIWWSYRLGYKMFPIPISDHFGPALFQSQTESISFD